MVQPKKKLLGWPGFTVESVNTHFLESREAQKVHMKQQPQGIRSTQAKEKEESNEEKESVHVEPKKHHNVVIIKVWDTKRTIFTDQTGRFPFQSIKGHWYLMVMVEIDSNVIDTEIMKNKT